MTHVSNVTILHEGKENDCHVLVFDCFPFFLLLFVFVSLVNGLDNLK